MLAHNNTLRQLTHFLEDFLLLDGVCTICHLHVIVVVRVIREFTVDLNSQEGSGLQNNGDFILKNEVVVVKNLEGNFIAASQICSHQQTDQVRFLDDNGGIFRCSTHGSEFDQNGTPLNTITNNPLKTFNTELNGNILRVFE